MNDKSPLISTTPSPGSYTPITNLVNSRSSFIKNRLTLVLVALLLVTAPIIGYNVYRSQTNVGKAVSTPEPELTVCGEPLADLFCGQAIPYCIIPPGSQLGPNECKKKSPVCYECRHESGRIELFGCCGGESPTPTPTPPVRQQFCPFECVSREKAVFCTPDSVVDSACPIAGEVCCRPTSPTPTTPVKETPTPTPPQECPLPQINVTISCPLCDIFEGD